MSESSSQAGDFVLSPTKWLRGALLVDFLHSGSVTFSRCVLLRQFEDVQTVCKSNWSGDTLHFQFDQLINEDELMNRLSTQNYLVKMF